MASHFLEGMSGFLVLDDPMVDLDLERQQLAADVLKDFAQGCQMIVFTCHPAHAALLSETPVELERLA
jgi:exonuclease SbcC